MVKDNQILLGKAGDKEVVLYPKMFNRHGLIAGATGTGKTITLKVIAESLSELGIPTVISDVKGDLTGMIEQGDMDSIQEILQDLMYKSIRYISLIFINQKVIQFVRLFKVWDHYYLVES